MPKVKFIKEKKEIEVPDGANLRQEARKAGIEIYPDVREVLNCHGNGCCTNCKVLIKSGVENVSPQSKRELAAMHNLANPFAMLTAFGRIGHEKELRLSCQTTVHGDIEVETQPGFNWHGDKFWA